MRCRLENEREALARTGFEIPNTGVCGLSCAPRRDESIYQRRQAVVEPVFGILKEQRGMRKFRRRGLAAVTTEWMLAAIAYNLTRMARVASWK